MTSTLPSETCCSVNAGCVGVITEGAPAPFAVTIAAAEVRGRSRRLGSSGCWHGRRCTTRRRLPPGVARVQAPNRGPMPAARVLAHGTAFTTAAPLPHTLHPSPVLQQRDLGGLAVL